MRKIFAIVGKASTGKDTLTNMLSEVLNIPIALSFTTRPMRTGEKQGVEYNFISDDDFWDLHGCDLLAEKTWYEVANGETWWYGLTKEEIEKDKYVLAIVNPDGLNQLRKIYGHKVCAILIDAPADIRIKRYLDRDEVTELKAEECCRRFLADQKDFKDISTNHVVRNEGELKKVFNDLSWLVRKEISQDLLNEVNSDFRDNPRRFLCR